MHSFKLKNWKRDFWGKVVGLILIGYLWIRDASKLEVIAFAVLAIFSFFWHYEETDKS